MVKIKRYLKEWKKSYILNTTFFIVIFIIAIFIFGPPRHYVVPISSMIVGYGIVEFIGYRRWKKDEF